MHALEGCTLVSPAQAWSASNDVDEVSDLGSEPSKGSWTCNRSAMLRTRASPSSVRSPSAVKATSSCSGFSRRTEHANSCRHHPPDTREGNGKFICLCQSRRRGSSNLPPNDSTSRTSCSHNKSVQACKPCTASHCVKSVDSWTTWVLMRDRKGE